MFKFIQEENQFIWQNDEVKLIFSDPLVNSHNGYTYITSIKQVMYFYYTVSIYRKGTDAKEKDTWIYVISKKIYYFPCILQLINILKHILYDKIKNEECQKIEYTNDLIGYKYIATTDSFACDDFYSIERLKIVDKNGILRENYNIYIGATINEKSNMTNVGVRTHYVDKKELESLYECAMKFVEYAIDLHNNQIKSSYI